MIMIIQSELRREREKKVSTERNEYKSHSKEMDKAGFYRFSRSPEKGPRRRGKINPLCARLLRIPSPSFTKQTQIRVIHITSFAFLPSNGTCDIRTDPGTRRRFLFFFSDDAFPSQAGPQS
jgi:hypothetical protein